MNIKPITIQEQNAFFADYLTNFSKVQDFFSFHYQNDWPAAIKARSGFEVPRNKLVEILSVQNRKWDAAEKTLENINRLKSPKTLAVVTGQQAGILGGPLYTFFKTMTVLRLASKLKKEHPEYDFVPVFWMEVNDNDFKEISVINYISKENQLKTLSVEEKEADALKPVFARQVDGQIRQWRQLLGDDFFDTEFKDAALNAFFDSYLSSQNYADAFAGLLLKFYGKHGLIVMNPSDPALCSLAHSLFTSTLQSSEAVLQDFNKRSETLQEAGYNPQISFSDNQTLLFYNDAQLRRVRIDFDPKGGFLLKYPEGYQSITEEKLLSHYADKPQCLSPNVALRPIMQDALLPTVAYVAGPAEVAYFAQVETLYCRFNIPMPVIYPRHRLTIVEGKFQKNVEKFNLDYRELLSQKPGFTEEFLRRVSDSLIDQTVENAEKSITQAMAQLQEEIAAFDPTLINSVEKTRQTIEGSFRQLSGKITRALEQKNQVQMQQLEKILLNLLPGNNFQERKLNMIYFCIKYGVSFVDEVFALLPDETKTHYILAL